MCLETRTGVVHCPAKSQGVRGEEQGNAEMFSPQLSPTYNLSSGNQRSPKCKTSGARNQETFEFKQAGKPMGRVHLIP